MKKILLCLALFCLATGPISCGDSNTDDGTEQGGGGNGGDGGGTGPEPEPGNPEITPEQHKAKLETIGKEVAAQFNPEDSKAAIESLTALEELLAFDDEDVAPSPAPKTYAVATAKSLAAVAAGPDVHALTSLIVRATTTEKYTLDEWAGDYVIEDGEPVKKGELANQYRLTWADAAGTQSEALFTYSAGGVEYTRVDGYAIVIPQDWNLSLKVAGHEELSVVGKSNVSADGLTLAPEVTVTLNGGYVAAAKVNADPKQVTANASFTKNGTQIVDAYAKMVCDGLTDPDNWIVEEEYDWNGDGVIDDTDTYIDPEDHIVDHVKTGEGYVTVMGLKLTLSGDIAKIIQQVNAIADTSTATGSQQEADAYNTNAKAKLAYTADNSTMADVKMQSYSYKDYIYVWNPDTQTGDNQVVTRYDIEPVLEFADGSKIAIEEYVETGFDSLTKTFEDLADAYMDLIDGN